MKRIIDLADMRTAIPVAVVAGAVALAGCGGSTATKHTATQTTPPPTRAEVIANGNAICARAHAATRKLGEPPYDPGHPTAAHLRADHAYLAADAAVTARTVAQLHRLGQPRQGVALLRQALTESDRLAASLRRASVAAAAGDVPAFTKAAQGLQTNRADELLGRFGMKICASD